MNHGVHELYIILRERDARNTVILIFSDIYIYYFTVGNKLIIFLIFMKDYLKIQAFALLLLK